MISAPDTPQGRRSLELAIIGAWWGTGSAAHIATAFSTGARKLHASDINEIWAKAKLEGHLPKLNRASAKARRRNSEGVSA